MVNTFTDEMAKEAIKSKELVIIDFFAEWCGPCKVVEPIIKVLSDNYSDKITFGKVDVSDNTELSTEYGVRSIPTVVFLKKGQIVDKTVGILTESEYEDKIKNLINT